MTSVGIASLVVSVVAFLSVLVVTLQKAEDFHSRTFVTSRYMCGTSRLVYIPEKDYGDVRRRGFSMVMRDDLGNCMFGKFCQLYESGRDDDPHVEEFFMLIKKVMGSEGVVGLDVGSNIGHKSLTMNALGFTTISIEPQFELMSLHDLSHSVNGFPRSDRIIHGLVGNRKKNVGDGEMGETTSMWKPGHSPEEWKGKRISAPLVDLSNLRFDFMKVDIDGYECHILKDITAPFVIELTIKLWKAKCGMTPSTENLDFIVGGYIVGNHPLNTQRNILRFSNSTLIRDDKALQRLIEVGKTFSVLKF